MSGSLHALQDHAQVASDSFCARYVKPSKRNRRHAGTHTHFDNTSSSPRPASGKFYRPRDHEASPFFKIVRDHFDEFEKVYPERYQERYGYWRPVIRSSIDKFLKCGDLKEGFARVRCPDCKEEFFVAFSCRQRCCCPSCIRNGHSCWVTRLLRKSFSQCLIDSGCSRYLNDCVFISGSLRSLLT